MQKAAEDLKNEQKRKQEEKEKAVRDRIGELKVDASTDKGRQCDNNATSLSA